MGIALTLNTPQQRMDDLVDQRTSIFVFQVMRPGGGQLVHSSQNHELWRMV
jgi:hypothetical protein